MCKQVMEPLLCYIQVRKSPAGLESTSVFMCRNDSSSNAAVSSASKHVLRARWSLTTLSLNVIVVEPKGFAVSKCHSDHRKKQLYETSSRVYSRATTSIKLGACKRTRYSPIPIAL